MTRVKTKALSFVSASLLALTLTAMNPQNTMKANAKEVENNIKIAGTQVTSDNASDVLIGDNGQFGFVDNSGTQTKTNNIMQSNITRIAGNNRYETAVKISQATYDKSECVVLTNGLSFADALAGIPLAQKLNAPILLTPKDTLNPDTLVEIKRLGAKHIIILGGEGAVSKAVEKTLSETASKIERIEGASRYGTSVEVAKVLNDAPDTLFFVSGNDYADALSVSPYAASQSAPIIYLPKNGNVGAETLDYLVRRSKRLVSI